MTSKLNVIFHLRVVKNNRKHLDPKNVHLDLCLPAGVLALTQTYYICMAEGCPTLLTAHCQASPINMAV